MNKKISTPLAISIIVVLAVIVGGGALGFIYYSSNANTEMPPIEIKKVEIKTDDWKTYKNVEYGFDFKYPEYLIFNEYPVNINNWKSIAFFDKSNKVYITFDIIETDKLSKNWGVDEKVFVGGTSGNRINTLPPNDCYNLMLDKGKFTYLIGDDCLHDMNLFNQMLSTFKFIENGPRTYNHAGQIVKIYQKGGKNYIDVDFIKFLQFTDVNGHPINTPGLIYGENDEQGNCTPVADPYCIVNNDKTIYSYEVAENVEIIPDNVPGPEITYQNLGELMKTGSPYFQLQIEDNKVKGMHQIYIP